MVVYGLLFLVSLLNSGAGFTVNRKDSRKYVYQTDNYNPETYHTSDYHPESYHYDTYEYDYQYYPYEEYESRDVPSSWWYAIPPDLMYSESQQLLELYHLIRLIVVYRAPSKYKTSLEQLVEELKDVQLQRKLVILLHNADGFNEIKPAGYHNFHQYLSNDNNFVNDHRMLIPAIQRTLNAIYLRPGVDDFLYRQIAELTDHANSITIKHIDDEIVTLKMILKQKHHHDYLLDHRHHPHLHQNYPYENQVTMDDLLNTVFSEIGGYGLTTTPGVHIVQDINTPELKELGGSDESLESEESAESTESSEESREEEAVVLIVKKDDDTAQSKQLTPIWGALEELFKAEAKNQETSTVAPKVTKEETEKSNPDISEKITIPFVNFTEQDRITGGHVFKEQDYVHPDQVENVTSKHDYGTKGSVLEANSTKTNAEEEPAIAKETKIPDGIDALLAEHYGKLDSVLSKPDNLTPAIDVSQPAVLIEPNETSTMVYDIDQRLQTDGVNETVETTTKAATGGGGFWWWSKPTTNVDEETQQVIENRELPIDEDGPEIPVDETSVEPQSASTTVSSTTAQQENPETTESTQQVHTSEVTETTTVEVTESISVVHQETTSQVVDITESSKSTSAATEDATTELTESTTAIGEVTSQNVDTTEIPAKENQTLNVYEVHTEAASVESRQDLPSFAPVNSDLDARHYVKNEVIKVLDLLEESGMAEPKQKLPDEDLDRLVDQLSQSSVGIQWAEMIGALQTLIKERNLEEGDKVVETLDDWKQGEHQAQVDDGYFEKNYGVEKEDSGSKAETEGSEAPTTENESKKEVEIVDQAGKVEDDTKTPETVSSSDPPEVTTAEETQAVTTESVTESSTVEEVVDGAELVEPKSEPQTDAAEDTVTETTDGEVSESVTDSSTAAHEIITNEATMESEAVSPGESEETTTVESENGETSESTTDPTVITSETTPEILSSSSEATPNEETLTPEEVTAVEETTEGVTDSTTVHEEIDGAEPVDPETVAPTDSAETTTAEAVNGETSESTTEPSTISSETPSSETTTVEENVTPEQGTAEEATIEGETESNVNEEVEPETVAPTESVETTTAEEVHADTSESVTESSTAQEAGDSGETVEPEAVAPTDPTESTTVEAANVETSESTTESSTATPETSSDSPSTAPEATTVEENNPPEDVTEAQEPETETTLPPSTEPVSKETTSPEPEPDVSSPEEVVEATTVADTTPFHDEPAVDEQEPVALAGASTDANPGVDATETETPEEATAEAQTKDADEPQSTRSRIVDFLNRWTGRQTDS